MKIKLVIIAVILWLLVFAGYKPHKLGFHDKFWWSNTFTVTFTPTFTITPTITQTNTPIVKYFFPKTRKR